MLRTLKHKWHTVTHTATQIANEAASLNAGGLNKAAKDKDKSAEKIPAAMSTACADFAYNQSLTRPKNGSVNASTKRLPSNTIPNKVKGTAYWVAYKCGTLTYIGNATNANGIASHP